MKTKTKIHSQEPLFDVVCGVLADNLRQMRGSRGLSQEKLALEAGVDRTLVSKIERLVANPSLEVLSRLAVALDISITQLLEDSQVSKRVRH
jgi:transcriptional regulator with XRE-family HTH domain